MVFSKQFSLERQTLARLGRRSYVSHSALAQILEEFKSLDSLPEACSRASIKRARQEEIRVETSVGPLFRKLDVRDAGSGKIEELEYIHPVALLVVVSRCCPSFGRFLSARLVSSPSTPQSHWRIVFYSDEVLPGNQRKHDNKRKVQTVYWTFLEFGAVFLSPPVRFGVL